MTEELPAARLRPISGPSIGSVVCETLWNAGVAGPNTSVVLIQSRVKCQAQCQFKAHSVETRPVMVECIGSDRMWLRSGSELVDVGAALCCEWAITNNRQAAGVAMQRRRCAT